MGCARFLVVFVKGICDLFRGEAEGSIFLGERDVCLEVREMGDKGYIQHRAHKTDSAALREIFNFP